MSMFKFQEIVHWSALEAAGVRGNLTEDIWAREIAGRALTALLHHLADNKKKMAAAGMAKLRANREHALSNHGKKLDKESSKSLKNKRIDHVAGGWGGIRTPGGREPTPVFKTGALNHSATHPSL